MRPVPAAESRHLAMVDELDGVSIVIDHAKRYDTPRALCLWASVVQRFTVLVAALTSWKASNRCTSVLSTRSGTLS